MPNIILPEITDDNSLSAADMRQIALIKKDTGRGGLWWSEVQAALQYLFSSEEKVFVPAATTLLGELHALPLKGLKARKVEFVAFSLAAASVEINRGEYQHQVAVWIDMRAEKVSVHIYNSEGNFLNKQALANLTTLMGDMLFEIVFGASPYAVQDDFWSCGVYVVMNLLHAYSPLSIDTPKVKLDVSTFLKKIYVAAERGKVLQEERELISHQQVALKHALHEALQEREIAALKELKTFLHFELNAASLVGGEVDHEHLRTRALPQTFKAFIKAYPSNGIGRCILQSALWASVHPLATMTATINNLLMIFAKHEKLTVLRVEKTDNNDLGILEKLYCVVLTTFQLAEQPTGEWQRLFDLLIKRHDQSCSEMLSAIVVEFEDLEGYQVQFDAAIKTPIDAYHFVCHLLMAAMNNMSSQAEEKKRLTSDAAAREEQAQKSAAERLPQLVAIFKTVALVVDEETCQVMASNAVLFYQLKKYFTPDYFSGCDNEARQAVLQEVKNSGTLHFIDMIALYPGNNYEKFYKSQDDIVTDKTIAIKILHKIKRFDNRLVFFRCYQRYLLTESMQSKVFNAFPKAERFDVVKEFAFFATCVTNVKNLLAEVSDEDKLALAAHFFTLNGDSYKLVLGALSPEEIKWLFIKFVYQIKPFQAMFIIGQAAPTDRLFYAEKFKKRMGATFGMLPLTVLNAFEKNSFLQPELTSDNENTREYAANLLACNNEQLEALHLVLLGSKSCVSFDHYVLKFSILPPALKAKNVDKFENELYATLNNECRGIRIPDIEKNGLIFEMVYLLITNTKVDKRVRVAKKFADFIFSSFELAKIFSLLKLEQNHFAICEDKPHLESIPFSDIVRLLPEPLRFEFAMKYHEKVNHFKIFIEILGVLPPDKRLAFTKKCKRSIINHIALYQTIPFLVNGSEAIDFAIENSQHIRNASELEAVMRPLTAKDVGTLFHHCVNGKLIIVTDKLISMILRKLSEVEREEFFNSCITDEIMQRLQAQSYILTLLFQQEPKIPQTQYQFLLEVILTSKHLVSKGSLLLLSSTMRLTFQNKNLPAFLRDIPEVHKEKLEPLLWPLMMLLEVKHITKDELAWLADNEHSVRLENLIALLTKMYEVDNQHVQTLLLNGFTVMELIDCQSTDVLKRVIDFADNVVINMRPEAGMEWQQKYKRATLGISVDDEKINVMVAAVISDAQLARNNKMMAQLKLFAKSHVNNKGYFAKTLSSIPELN